MYNNPQPHRQAQVWSALRSISSTISCSWAILGDFNAMLHPSEQVGGWARPKWSRINDFHSCLFDCGLSNLGL